MQMAIASAMSPDPLILWLHSGLRKKWFLCVSFRVGGIEVDKQLWTSFDFAYV